MRIALLFILFATLGVSAHGESAEVVAKLLRTYHQLTLETGQDESRNDESPFSEIDFSDSTPDEYTAIAKMMRKSIADLRAELLRPYPGLTDNERIEAYRSLETSRFSADAKISTITKRRIVAAIVAQPAIDPRIRSMSYIDKRTVKLIAGNRCSTWCAFGLHCYIARLENGRWIIRPADLLGPTG